MRPPHDHHLLSMRPMYREMGRNGGGGVMHVDLHPPQKGPSLVLMWRWGGGWGGCVAPMKNYALRKAAPRKRAPEGVRVEGGGRGVWLGPPPRVPLWSPLRARQRIPSVNPLGTKGAEAKFWLSASDIGRGGGGGPGGGGGGTPPPPAVYSRSNTSLGWVGGGGGWHANSHAPTQAPLHTDHCCGGK